MGLYSNIDLEQLMMNIELFEGLNADLNALRKKWHLVVLAN